MVRAVFGQEKLMDFDAATGYVIGQGRSHIPEGARCVAIAHAFLAGGQSADSERPLMVGGSSNVSPAWFRGYTYTALGHLHSPQQAGAASVRYSGSLMKYSFSEAAQKKGVYVVDLDGVGNVQTDFLPLTPRRDLRRVSGYFDTILQDREAYPYSEDYMQIELLDTAPILDAQSRLRTVYPNFLDIRRTGLERSGELQLHGREYQNQSEQELFQSFFAEMTGEAMKDEEQKVLQASLAEVFRGMREGKA